MCHFSQVDLNNGSVIDRDGNLSIFTAPVGRTEVNKHGLTFGVTQKNQVKIKFKDHWHVLDKKQKSGREYWRCSKRKCHGRLLLCMENPPVQTKGHDCVVNKADSVAES
jgi:hypothetical protein